MRVGIVGKSESVIITARTVTSWDGGEARGYGGLARVGNAAHGGQVDGRIAVRTHFFRLVPIPLLATTTTCVSENCREKKKATGDDESEFVIR